MKYSYKAIDVNGNEITGDLEAERTDDVGTWLSDRGYIVVSITQSTLKSIVGENHKYLRINQKDMNFFLIQLSNLIIAGCPLLMRLIALYKQVSN